MSIKFAKAEEVITTIRTLQLMCPYLDCCVLIEGFSQDTTQVKCWSCKRKINIKKVGE